MGMNYTKMDQLAKERDELLALYPEAKASIWLHYIEMMQPYLNQG